MKDDPFATTLAITVRQSKAWLEILTGIEKRNHFAIDLPGEPEALAAAEEGGNWLLFVLGSMRPYTLGIYRRDRSPFLRLHAPFRWYYREITVRDADGKLLGRVRRRLSFPHTRYDVFDARDAPLFEIARGFVKAWTFRVLRAEREVATIVKRWSGLGREVFTDADRFTLEFADVRDVTQRKILLGALFLIDMQHFEAAGNG